jgi:hypothetical protein
LILQRYLNLIQVFPAETGIEPAPSENDNVTVTKEFGNLVFKSRGNFYAMDLYLSGPNQFLKSPLFIDRTVLTASNITDTTYAIGICSPSPLKEHTVLMKIPFLPESDSLMKFKLYVNGDPKQIFQNLNSVIPLQIDSWNFWPNPADDVLNLYGITIGSLYEILDPQGKLILNGKNSDNKIDISHLPGGFYFLKIITAKKLLVKSFVKLKS